MSREKENIDKRIRKKLLQAEVAPPASVWSGIERTMAKKQRKAIVLLYRRVGYAAAVLLLGFLAYYFVRSDRDLNQSENKLSLQLNTDSTIANIDSASKVKSFEKRLAENESEKQELKSTKSDILKEKENALPSIARIEKTFVGEEEPIVNSTQTSFDERRPSNYSKIAPVSIALRKSAASPMELSSLYKSSFNPLSLLKAVAYKRQFEYEEASILLAENSKKTNKQSWAIGLAFSPTSVGRFSGLSTQDAGVYYAGDAVFSGGSGYQPGIVSEKDLPAYSGGVNLEFNISERWSFQSGIYYLKQGQSIENFSILENDINASKNTNSYFGNISIDNPTILEESGQMADFYQLSDNISYSRFDADLIQQFELLEIPFLASYKIINRKLVFSIAAGLNQGFLIGNRVYLSDYSSESIGKTEAMNKLIFKSVFGFSFEYPLSRKLYFNLSPFIKYQLTNFNKNATKGEHLQYFEFKTGINYRF